MTTKEPQNEDEKKITWPKMYQKCKENTKNSPVIIVVDKMCHNAKAPPYCKRNVLRMQKKPFA